VFVGGVDAVREEIWVVSLGGFGGGKRRGGVTGWSYACVRRRRPRPVRDFVTRADIVGGEAVGRWDG